MDFDVRVDFALASQTEYSDDDASTSRKLENEVVAQVSIWHNFIEKSRTLLHDTASVGSDLVQPRHYTPIAQTSQRDNKEALSYGQQNTPHLGTWCSDQLSDVVSSTVPPPWSLPPVNRSPCNDWSITPRSDAPVSEAFARRQTLEMVCISARRSTRHFAAKGRDTSKSSLSMT
jgi:hypothetical protein